MRTVAPQVDPPTRLLNLAAVCPATRVLGPGLRGAIWVQGCPFRCSGCVSPEWLATRVNRLVEPERLAETLLSRPIDGVTFSGGEPMLQASGLLALLHALRRKHIVSAICFTGFTLEQLREAPPEEGVPGLLSEIDVLIDGPYVCELDDGRGMRGSSNQRIHFLSSRPGMRDFDYQGRKRDTELHVADGEALLVGVPPSSLTEDFRSAVAAAGSGWRKRETDK